VGAPGRAVPRIIDLEHGDVRHEAIYRRSVPVVLAWLEEHAIARADHLDTPTAALREACAARKVRRLF
jgi:hypothetical protein